MKNAELAAIGLGWLGVGVNAPVMSLMLLSHGCTLEQLGLAMGVYSLAAILAEAPSGFLSDLWGRRRMFWLSRLCRLASYAALLFARSLLPVLAAMAAQGLASACESGSLSAVVIERARREQGEAGMKRMISILSALQCAALAIGALAGGWLPNVRGYSLHLLCASALAVLCAALTGLCREEKTAQKKPRAGAYFANWLKQLGTSKELKGVLLCMALAAVPVFMVETYWQTWARERMSQGALGLLCASAYGATVLGSLLAGRVAWPRWRLYALALAGVALCLWVMPSAAFAAAYLAFYALLGMQDVAEQTIVNAASADENRSGMMSVAALCGKAGGAASGMLGGWLIGGWGVPGLWRMAGAAALLAAGFAAVRARCALRPEREKAS